MFKKLVLFVGFLGLLLIGIQKAQAGSNYTVALTSYTIASDTTTFDAAYPNISNGCNIDKIVFCTTNTISTPLLIGVYDNCTSTTAATVDRYFVLSGTNTSTLNGNVYVEEYPYYNPLHLTNPGFFKADGDTTHKIYLNINYR